MTAPAASLERRPVYDTGTHWTAGKVVRRVLLYGVLVALSLVFTLPLLWMVTTSLKEQGQVFQIPPQWIPNPVRWDNYPEATHRAPLWIWLNNTAIITVLATAGSVISASMVGFGFARLRFPGRGFLFVLLLSTMMLPPIVPKSPEKLTPKLGARMKAPVRDGSVPKVESSEVTD